MDFAYNYYVNQVDGSDSGTIGKDENTLENEIAAEIGKLGITSGICGRDYITEAILIILNLYSNNKNGDSINLNTHIYPVIAKKHKKSDKSAEQGIRNAIKRAWLITDIDTLAKNYTSSVSYRTGFPENRDFIFFYVDKYKGKAC